MKVLDTRMEGPKLVVPAVFGDERGFFTETFRESVLAEHGITDHWVQDNHSRSARGVVRGLHFAIGAGSAKLVRCARGRILDVVVDLRAGSPTYAEWEGFELSDEGEGFRVVYVPRGFAHGFCVLSDVADVVYKQSAYYAPDVERGIAYDDPQIGVAWPAGLELQVSARDAEAPQLHDIAHVLDFR